MKIIIFAVIFFALQCNAQTQDWYNYTCGNKVFDILSHGNDLWIGTDGGLFKLNKFTEEITSYNRANAGIPDNYIFSLTIDRSDNIWFGTQDYGIGKFNGENCIIYNMDNSSLPSDHWNSKIKIDSMVNIWIGSSKYLSVFDGTNWRNFETGSPVAAFTAIHDIHFDKKGDTLIGATWGLGKFVNGNLIEKYGNFSKEIHTIRSDSNNILWIGTRFDGLIKYDGVNWTVYDTTNSGIPGNVIYDMEYDKNGNLWIASHEGLVKFDGSDWIVYNTGNSGIIDNAILSIEIDENGIIWLGSFNYGLMRFDGTNWKSYKLGMLFSQFIYAIEIDKSNNVWLGTNNGMTKITHNKSVHFNHGNSGLKNDYIQSVLSTVSGDIWIGSRGYDCLTKYDGTNWTVFDSLNSILKEEIVESIQEDSESNIWLATWKGIVKYDGYNWTRFDHINTPMTSPVILDLVFDKENLWAAMAAVPYVEGWKGGLIKFTGKEWTIYSKENSSLPSNSINCLSIDSENNLWIGTSLGLAKFDGNNNWNIYNTQNSGLPSNSILRIFNHNKDTLWIGTSNGLSRLINEKEWTTYNVTNSGLANNYVWAIDEDKNGNMWIAHHTPGGLSVFREGGIIITNVVDNKLINLPKSFVSFPNYPNPFNPGTTISFSLPEEGKVIVKVFDILGREVAILLNEYKQSGSYNVVWNGKDAYGSEVSSGVYFYNIRYKDKSLTQKMMLVR